MRAPLRSRPSSTRHGACARTRSARWRTISASSATRSRKQSRSCAEAERAAEQAARDLAAALERRQRLAMEKIALAESRATAEVRNAAVDVAITAVRRILAETLDAERKRKLVDDAIAELPQRLN
jgi:F0F1-type ATP synthase membrane subunit b/b'